MLNGGTYDSGAGALHGAGDASMLSYGIFSQTARQKQLTGVRTPALCNRNAFEAKLRTQRIRNLATLGGVGTAAFGITGGLLMAQAAAIIQALGAPFVFVILLLMMISGTIPLVALWVLLRKSDERFMSMLEKGDLRYTELLTRVMDNMERYSVAMESYQSRLVTHEDGAREDHYPEHDRTPTPPGGYRIHKQPKK